MASASGTIAGEHERGAAASGSLWGLTPVELHDAYWSSHGVACVRLGSGIDPQPGADLYLLVEDAQCVLFDLRSLAEPLFWNQAHLTRVRILEAVSQEYGERIRLAPDGSVERIERRYGAERRESAQIFLATRRADALFWSQRARSRDALADMRRAGRLRIDVVECGGERFDVAAADGADALLRSLVERWPRPDRVLDGVVQLAPGVFAPSGSTMAAAGRLVAPIWLGAGASSGNDEVPAVVIGPAALPDTVPATGIKARPIDEIFTPESTTRAERAADPAGWYGPVKRLVDVVVSAAVLLGMAPVLLLCAAIIVVDDGFPVLFGHRRQTKGGATFRCWKFRTMRRNAEALVAELRKQNLCDGPQVFIKDDPRVTRVGRYLRKLQLDEFPQFWNVLVGDMSIVGPRPSPDKENQFCPAWREIRLSVRPGITGNWQVHRTREEGKDFQEWIRYDIEYVERMGPLFDLRLCVMTVVNMLRRKGG